MASEDGAATPPRFDAYAQEDHSSEVIFNGAVARLGGVRTTDFLGQNLSHANADWVFPNQKMLVEHKQIENALSESDGFKAAEVALRVSYVRQGKANIFGSPHDPAAFAPDYIGLYKKPLARIVKKANIQVRQTRQRLGWPKGSGVLALSNKSLLALRPIAICILVQEILGGAYSEIGGVAYVTNHYLDVEGSDLAHVGWFPVYKEGGEHTPERTIHFVDALGAAFFEHIAHLKGDNAPQTQIPLGTDEALPFLAGRPITPRS